MQNECPTGIIFIDLLKNFKIYTSIKHFKCNKYKKSMKNKVKDLHFITKCDKTLNKSQEFLLNFFTSIFSKQSEMSHQAIKISIMYWDHCQALKFEHAWAGLSFCLVL